MAKILIVDDRPDEDVLTAHFNQLEHVSARVLHPEDVTVSDLSAADLVLVDYQLDAETWPEMQQGSIARQPRDGLALACLLRRHVHRIEKASPTAFGILSSDVRRLASPLPAENRLHVLARGINLEWVFTKSEPRLGQQVSELANAVKALPASWPRDDALAADRQLMTVLGLDKDSDRSLIDDVTACIPPVNELSEWSHSLAIVRWLLHRILPYPCFLWDSYHLAARLRVDHEWLIETLKTDPTFTSWLGEAQYGGLLHGFMGARWWRWHVERLLWDATNQKSFNVDKVFEAVSAKSGREAKRSSPPDYPLVTVNSDFRALTQFSSRSDSVRIRPDDWPSYADQPWTTTSLARTEPGLKAVVVYEDREKLEVQ